MSNLPFLAAALLAAAALAPSRAAAQSQSPLLGRWDLTVDTPDLHRASWLEVRTSGRSMLVGSFVNRGGSARPVSRIDETNGAFRFTIPPQWDESEGETTVSGRLQGDSVSGTIRYASGKSFAFRGARAPSLRRTAPPQWELPVTLFNGRDLSGWKTYGPGANNWVADNGVLRNTGGGTNLVTERAFGDFKLHVEFRYPKGSNSGIYLRGRYEVQVEDTPGSEPNLLGIGAVYGHLLPNEVAALGPDRWQSYDITLIGRRVTVVLNGKTVIADQLIPGTTGGAIDSQEGLPGPIYLQGDHGPVEFRNIVITPAT
jgi:Domain of Unknown Function (DUF1080)